MKSARFHRGSAFLGALVSALLSSLLLAGCGPDKPTDLSEKPPAYASLPRPKVPPFMQGTLFERIRFTNTDPYTVYGYSLVVNLRDTGDSTAPTLIRDYIAKQIQLHGFQTVQYDYANLSPSEIFSSKKVAIVSLESQIPVGAHIGQRVDVTVRAMPRSYTTSLEHGQLYDAEMSPDARVDPTGVLASSKVHVVGGQIFVNPAYALPTGQRPSAEARGSLKEGIVMDGGVVKFDRPIHLQLREPSVILAREVEELIRFRFHSRDIAQAQNEAIIEIYMPPEFNGDWKHFVGVVSHMYLDQTAEFINAKANELITEARKPHAKLADISLCWEGMGPDIIPLIEPLVTDNNPDIAFAAARAAAFLGDNTAREVVLQIASNIRSPYQLDAVRTLGELPRSPEVNGNLRTLLGVDKADVRIAAYNILGSSDEGITSQVVNGSYILDVIPSGGPPLIYVSRSGIPRVAVFGNAVHLSTPITFSAIDHRLEIASTDGTDELTLFYRDPNADSPVDLKTPNDVPRILSLLGGEDCHLTFNEVVAVMQQLVGDRQIYGTSLQGDQWPALYEMQHPAADAQRWDSIPGDNLKGRPIGGGAPDALPNSTIAHDSP